MNLRVRKSQNFTSGMELEIICPTSSFFFQGKFNLERLSDSVTSTCPMVKKSWCFFYSHQISAHAYSSHNMNTADFVACHQPCMSYRLLIKCYCVCLLQYPWQLHDLCNTLSSEKAKECISG